MQILLVDESIVILIDHVESLFEFGDLRLVEHRENVRCRALGAFLRGGTATGSFAGRHLRRSRLHLLEIQILAIGQYQR